MQALSKSIYEFADGFGLIDDDDDFDECSRSPDEHGELEHARSRLLCRDIPEALIHIERALPEFLDGLPEAVARHYASRP